MTLYVQRMNGRTLRVRDGHIRLRSALSAFGYANVTELKTAEQFLAASAKDVDLEAACEAMFAELRRELDRDGAAAAAASS